MDEKKVNEIFEKCENQLFTLNDLFSGNRFYRIPTNQRGYSWNEKNLEEFWDDVNRCNNSNNGRHYMGMLCLESLTDNSKILEYLEGYDAFYVVDGQQRLATCIILISAIYNKLNKNLVGCKEKFISQNNTIKFEYSKQNNSNINEIFKEKIFENSNKDEYSDNLYVNKLLSAKKFFKEKIKDLEEKDCETLFKTITNNLFFNVVFTNDNSSNNKDKENFDARLMFETINNRGKPLSNLEKLKNRLFYISDYLDYGVDKNIIANNKQDLINNISKSWNKIYDNLGKISTEESDDSFLVTHWLMYSKSSVSKEKNPEIKEIFEKCFSLDYANREEDVKELFENPGKDGVENYIESLSKTSEYWVWINTLSLPKEANKYSEELQKLNRIMTDDKYVKAFILYLFDNQFDNQGDFEEDLIKKVLEVIEKYLFVSRFIYSSTKRITYSFFATFVKDINKSQDKKATLLEKVRALIDGKDKNNQEIKEFNSIKSMLNEDSITTWINRNSANFYSNWKDGLKYLLFDYNLYKFSNGNQFKEINWEKFSSKTIEHIYPQHPDENTLDGKYWKLMLGDSNLSDDGKKMMVNALGNLIPLSQTINSAVSNLMFPDKRKNKRKIKNVTYYSYSSDTATSNDIANQYNKNWSINDIKERTRKIIEYIEKHWLKIDKDFYGCGNEEINCKFSDKNILKILNFELDDDPTKDADYNIDEYTVKTLIYRKQNLTTNYEKFWENFIQKFKDETGKDIKTRSKAKKDIYIGNINLALQELGNVKISIKGMVLSDELKQFIDQHKDKLSIDETAQKGNKLIINANIDFYESKDEDINLIIGCCKQLS